MPRTCIAVCFVYTEQNDDLARERVMTTHTHLNTISRRFSRIGLILLLAAPLLLAGCGQKGDLYHPEKASSHRIQQA